MRLLASLGVLLWSASFTPLAEVHCQGCVDVSTQPSVATWAPTCPASVTATVTALSGECFGFGDSCAESPCTPHLSIHSASAAQGEVTGTIGDVKYGPMTVKPGSNTVVFRGYVEVACGGEVPYSFTIEYECEPPTVSHVDGELWCTDCVPLW